MMKDKLIEEINKQLLGLSEQSLSDILDYIKKRELEKAMVLLDKIMKEEDGLMRRLADS